MIEVYKNIFVGTEQDCTYSNPIGWAFIHACKYPCHAKAVGYSGSLPANHPNYLIFIKSNHLYLNMVDMENELLPRFTNPIISEGIKFIDSHIENNKILIHCNQGQSRSPSIALIYLANKGIINNGSFNEAFHDFIKLYKLYQPGRGIGLYINRNWTTLMNL
jgi:hypothetical protein